MLTFGFPVSGFRWALPTNIFGDRSQSCFGG